jgi:hypothetical protein
MVSKEVHEKILKVFAIVLLVLVLGNFTANMFFWGDSWTEILWFCSLASIALSVGILLKNPLLNSIVLITTIPAQSLWIADFLLNIFGLDSFGRTEWLFELPLVVVAFSIILHFMIIPLAIYAVAVYGFKKKSFFIGVASFVILVLISFFITPFEENINCVFYSCDLDFDSLEGIPTPLVFGWNLSFGSFQYLGFVLLRWFGWFIVSYYVWLLLFQRVFKRVQIV